MVKILVAFLAVTEGVLVEEITAVVVGVLEVEGEVKIEEMVLLLVVTAGVVRVLILVKILVNATGVLLEEMIAVVVGVLEVEGEVNISEMVSLLVVTA